MDKKIAVIFTGGTIGSIKNDGIVNLSGASRYELINGYDNIDTFAPIDVLSENMTKQHLYRLVECIDEIKNDYKGIIITHGTDTLTFTAQYLSLVFAEIDIPVIIVSSCYPLQDTRQNGSVNFDVAYKFINQGHKGVYVSYKNDGEPCKIHLAGNIISPRQLDGYVDSIYHKCYAYYDGEFHYSGIKSDNLVSNTHKLGCKVIFIKQHSLLNYDLIPLKRGTTILIECYHSGTVYNYNNAFIDFLQKCYDNKVNVALAPIDEKANIYDSMKDIIGKVKLFKNMPVERAMVICMLGDYNISNKE